MRLAFLLAMLVGFAGLGMIDLIEGRYRLGIASLLLVLVQALFLG